MTDKEKIIEIIAKNETYNGRSLSFDYYLIQPDDLINALIENNIGDVTEWKKKVEQATAREKFEETERKYANNRENECRKRIKIIEQERDEWKKRAEVVEKALKKFSAYIQCSHCPFNDNCKIEHISHYSNCFYEYLHQAEKELQEERE